MNQIRGCDVRTCLNLRPCWTACEVRSGRPLAEAFVLEVISERMIFRDAESVLVGDWKRLATGKRDKDFVIALTD